MDKSMTTSLIHPTAIIDPQAQLDSSVSVGPYSVIGPKVTIGKGSSVGAHCVIEGRTTIGQSNRIFQFNSIGAEPQDKKYAGEDAELIIGDRNVIREFCTLNIGTATPEQNPLSNGIGKTVIGNDNWIMAYVHVAHDCTIGNNTIFANNSQLAGHVEVGDWVILGGFTVVHQFVRLGAHAMTAMCSLLFADLPPYVMCQGQPAGARSMNFEGLRRRGFSPERVVAVKTMHKLLYRSDLSLDAACNQIDALKATTPASAADIALLVDFLRSAPANRGIVR
jgi:UDP-N-acetylglucosamine acyltransferase